MRGVDLLATGNLVLGTTKGLKSVGGHSLTATDRGEDLTDLDTSDGTVGLTEGTTHTSLETISTSAGKHLVDTEHVEWVHADTDVESILTRGLHHVLVAGNTASLKGLRGDLLELIGHKVSAEGELIAVGLLATEIVNADLWVWHTTA